MDPTEEAPNAQEESATGSNDTAASQHPAAHQDSEEQRKLNDEKKQQEAIQTPFKDKAEELDEDEDKSGSEAESLASGNKASPSPTPGKESPSSNDLKTFSIFSKGEKTAISSRKVGLRQPTGYRKTSRKK